MQIPQGRWSPGRCWLTACEDTLEGDECVAPAGTGASGWDENNFDRSVHDLQNSLVAGVAGNVLGDAGSVAASARRGENDVGGHSLEFENSVYVRLAEPVCMSSLDGNLLNSVTCHPSMHAPSLARVIDGKSGGFGGMVSGEGSGRGLRGGETARLDVLLHDVFRPVPACSCLRIQGLPEFYDCSCARESTCSNSRPVRGPEPQGETKWSRRGSLCKVRQDVGEKFAFPQQLSGKLHVETWAGGCKSLNLRISQKQEIEGRCAVVGFPPRTPSVTPVLPKPGSDIRMKMEWKVMAKMGKSGVWFFQNAGRMWEREVGSSVAYGRGRLGLEGVVPHGMVGSLWFLVLLLVFVWTGPSCRVAYWRAVLATASRCVEGYRTPDEALAC